MTALDYTSPIPGLILKQRNVTDVFRYLGNPNVWPKAMNIGEPEDLAANGIRLHLNYEQAADFMMSGYNGGQRFAREARYWATWLGRRTNELIIYSADFSEANNNIQTILDFLNGAASVDGGKSNVGCYGSYAVISAAIDNGFLGWQTEAWSYGAFDHRAIAWQMGGQVVINGVTCDLNVMNSNYNTGGGKMSNPIPQSIRDKWPAIADQFQGSYDDSVAIIWTDAAARYAAFMADQIMEKLNQLSIPVPTVANVELTSDQIDAIATAVAKKFGTDLSAG